jgi:hypothetical protein
LTIAELAKAKSKHFFFKKSSKKLLLIWVSGVGGQNGIKSFLLLFFKKEVLSFLVWHRPDMPVSDREQTMRL